MRSGRNKISLDSLNGTYQFIDENRLVIKRDLSSLKSYVYQEVIGPSWLIGKVVEGDIQIKCRTEKRKKTIDKDMFIYAPAFSLPEFHVGRGNFKVEILISKIKCYKNAPLFSCVFKSENGQDLIELSNSLINGEIINPLFSLEYNEDVSALALKTKDYIDKFYRESIKISEIARKYKTAQAVITRYFKKAYHITPIKYLNELRAKEAVSLIMRDKRSVLDTSMLLGFNNQRQLYDSFKKVFKSIPSQLQK